MFVSQAPDGARSPVYTEGIPGLTLKASIGNLPVRGMWTMASILYVVVGTSLHQVDEDYTTTDLGTIPGASRVSMADNGTQLCIVNGSSGYIYTVAAGLVQITDEDFPGAATVAYLDSYFIFNNPGTQQFFISSLLDGTIYDASDFASAESFPDPLIAVFVDHRELFLFGTDTVEIWFNSGAADFPFERATGASVEKGIGAKFSVAKLDNSLLWLDHTGIVRRMGDGYQPIRVSTHSEEVTIAAGDWQNAYAYTYVQEGHEFYALTIPGAETLVYDAASRLWHTRSSFGTDIHRAGFEEFVYDKHIVGDVTNGNIYEMTFDEEEENGEPIIAEMIFPQIRVEDSNRFTVYRLELDLEVGVGLATGQGSDPLAMLQISSDGGKTWGNNELIRSLGVSGKYEQRVYWDRLGQHRSFTPRIRISDPVQRAVYTAYVQVRQDRN